MKKHMLITAKMMMPDTRALVTEFILNRPLFSGAETHTHTHKTVILPFFPCRCFLSVFIINFYSVLVITVLIIAHRCFIRTSYLHRG